jgi:hypothetical protein
MQDTLSFAYLATSQLFAFSVWAKPIQFLSMSQHDCSLQVTIYTSFYVEATNRDAFMSVKQDLLLAFIDCVDRNGAKLAKQRLEVRDLALCFSHPLAMCRACLMTSFSHSRWRLHQRSCLQDSERLPRTSMKLARRSSQLERFLRASQEHRQQLTCRLPHHHHRQVHLLDG